MFKRNASCVGGLDESECVMAKRTGRKTARKAKAPKKASKKVARKATNKKANRETPAQDKSEAAENTSQVGAVGCEIKREASFETTKNAEQTGGTKVRNDDCRDFADQDDDCRRGRGAGSGCIRGDGIRGDERRTRAAGFAQYRSNSRSGVRRTIAVNGPHCTWWWAAQMMISSDAASQPEMQAKRVRVVEAADRAGNLAFAYRNRSARHEPIFSFSYRASIPSPRLSAPHSTTCRSNRQQRLRSTAPPKTARVARVPNRPRTAQGRYCAQGIGHVDADQMNEGQCKANCDRRKSCRRLAVG